MEQEMCYGSSRRKRESYMKIIWRSTDKKLARFDVRRGCSHQEAQQTLKYGKVQRDSKIHYRQSSTWEDLTWSFQLYTRTWWCPFGRKHISSFEFWSFPRLAIWGIVLSYDARQRWQAAAFTQPHNHEDKQLIHLLSFCIYTTSLFFIFSTVFSNLHEIINTLL